MQARGKDAAVGLFAHGIEAAEGAEIVVVFPGGGAVRGESHKIAVGVLVRAVDAHAAPGEHIAAARDGSGGFEKFAGVGVVCVLFAGGNKEEQRQQQPDVARHGEWD